MIKKEYIPHSILIVSAVEKFDELVKRSLAPGIFMSVEFRKSAAAARRCILERYYDMIVINIPLPDENGMEFILDAAEKSSASILAVVPSDSYENVLERITDYGVLAIAKPFPRMRLGHAIRFLTAQQNRINQLEKKLEVMQEKEDDTRIITRAKFYLVENKHMTEDEAHRYIGTEAMNNGVSRRRIAERILE